MKTLIVLILALTSQIGLAHERHTGFDPKVHGFNFANTFQNDMVREFDIRTGGLCGGMVYAAYDYYVANKTIPQQDYRPAVQTELHDYIYDRQVDSLSGNIDKWIELGFNPLGDRNSDFFNWGLQGNNGGRIQELRQFIDQGKPVPLGLWHADGYSGGDHQVLAIGYKMGRYKGDLGAYKEDFEIYIYDPNFPNETQTLKADPATKTYYYTKALALNPKTKKYQYEERNKRWLTYFVDQNYHNKTPATTVSNRVHADGLVRKLRFEISTGDDDLRGGNDNLNIEVHYFNKTSQKFNNVNNSRRWIDNYTQTIELNLREAVKRTDISHFVLTTTFYSGLGKDKWNMDRIKVYVIEKGTAHTLIEKSGKPLHRFQPESQRYRLEANLTAVSTIKTSIPAVVKPRGNRCQDSVQNKIAWDYKGNKRWAQANLDKLCANNTTDQPAKCFNTVMHGNVNWGGGTQWQWGNATKLCSNTLNANRTVVCFKSKIKKGENWSSAISACKR